MLLSTTKDPLILAKLDFFSYIAGTMEPFLREHQYTKPMMTFMCDGLHQLLRDRVSKYIKPETLEKCKIPCLFSDVNFSDAKNLLRKKQVDIGLGANKVLTDKIKTNEIAKLEIDVFTVDCLKLFESLASKFVEKSALKYAVV